MSADYFVFGDFDSRNYNLYLHDTGNGRERFLAPAKQSITARPLGTSGELLFDQYFLPKDISLEVYMVDEDLAESRIQEIANYLGTLGSKKLILSYENYKYHNCVVDNKIESVQYSQGMIFATLNFKALIPHGFSSFTTSEIVSGTIAYDQGWIYNSGILYAEDMSDYNYTNIVSGTTATIYHGGNSNYAIPNFKFTGAATTLKVEQFYDVELTRKLGEFTYGAFSGSLDVNYPLFSCFKNGVMDNKTWFNSGITYLYGRTTPRFLTSGSIQNFSGNTVTLASTASGVNNYYNGAYIYMLNNQTCEMQRRGITAYNGTTKIATLDSAFSGISIADSYDINLPTDGKNYFKITGTGFTNLNLLVDFRYVYI